MNSDENNIEFQVQLWAIAGPFIALATLATLFFKASPEAAYLSWTLLAGVLLCWKWKLKGLMGALVLLIGAVGYHIIGIPIEERLWHLGMSIATGLTFIITALSFDEIESLVSSMEKESSGRLKSLLQMDEKLDIVQSRLESEKNSLAFKLREEQSKIQSYERLIEATREEMLTTHAEQEKLLRDLFDSRHEMGKVKEQLENEISSQENSTLLILQKEQEIAELQKQLSAVCEEEKAKSTNLDAQIEELRKQVVFAREEEKARGITLVLQKEQQIDELHKQMALASEEEKAKNTSLTQQKEQESEHLRQQLKQLASKLQDQDQELQHLHQVIQTHEQNLPPLHQEIAQLRDQLAKPQEETLTPEEKMSRWEAMYKQLRQQFDEKSRLLDDTRRELFHAMESATALELERKQQGLDRTEMEKGLECSIADIEADRQQLIREVNHLQDLVTQLMSQPVYTEKT